jgi:Mg-chelatase subunit ChlD
MRFLYFFFSVSVHVMSQNSAIVVDEKNKDIGAQENIYKVRADYVIQNTLAKNLYLLRADATKGITIKASKKTLKPNDTTLIVVEFIPSATGKFSEAIHLVTSADGLPYDLGLSGTIKSIKTDDKTACFYFKKPNKAGVKETQPIVVYEDHSKRDNSNKIPDNTTAVVTPQITPEPKSIEPKKTVPEIVKPEPVKNETALNSELYKPNNIVFVIDVSSSMKDSLKLPVLQYSMQYLIEALRPTDVVTLISYADSVRVLKEGISGSHKEELMETVNLLKARGLTKGNKAILFSLDKAVQHYITEGNNQIILATDGKFRFYSEDQQTFIAKKGDKTILLSTLAFGNDKDAMKNLKEIAEIGKGNFIHIKSKSKAKDQLLDEIKEHSLIH